ncbi:RagB/SusD family nutrient uptake outer membrane protein [Chitinophaga sp. Cy-1792]|uniref:RagB/SusD family nutrient uptake outer membrane protein n=1 Tax=Chitinophaga sp. Cy-1792 TaxID=2608339 RepID=UPI0014217D6C|nr:RagB/SusD family nutrient uptake outer membrane protein [Chitinophaga sp. Cy-1792]NIG54128.1 RagB/SusD family nutrient uptake outer membrane protein [Chitinophaga sp. Cy-1792]
MKKLFIIFSAVAVGLISSCQKDYLNVKKIDANISTDLLYSNYPYFQSAVYNAYSYLPDGLGNITMEAASDFAEATNVTDNSQLFNLGIWSQYLLPDSYWTLGFGGIRQANLVLKNFNKVNLQAKLDKINGPDSTDYKNSVYWVKMSEGEMYFLRAFYYFELVKRYGPMPIMDTAVDYNNPDSYIGMKRNTLDECIKYIVSNCDKAAAILPVTAANGYDQGLALQGAALALKARTLLYAASPLYKEAGCTATWDDAAKAANAVIALNAYSLESNYKTIFGSSNVGSKEAIFYKRYGAINTLEASNYPIAFQGATGNSLTPTQNFVDEFEVVTRDAAKNPVSSVPFDWNNPVHAANPYANRDPRLDSTLYHDGSVFSGFTTATIETFTGGSSGLPKQNASKTGYYLAKYVNATINLNNGGTGTTAAHAWIYFRYAEILLDYAEAMYNANGPVNNPNGYKMTALEAINAIRNRSSVKMPLYTAANLTADAIQHERNVELGMEGHRFWDVRRLKNGVAVLNAPVYRVEITKSGTSKTYVRKKLEDRVYLKKMDWYPIPQSEITKTGWNQNGDWK